MTLSTSILETWAVYTSEELYADIGDWTEAPSLIPISLRKVLFPEVDVAKFIYHCGEFPIHFNGVSPGTYSPISGMRYFIRLKIFSGATEIEDWIGIVNRTDLDNLFGGSSYVAGDLTFTAFGLIDELQKKIVSTSAIANEIDTAMDDEYFIINRAIGFNEDVRDIKPGNKQPNLSYGAPMFSKAPNREIENDTDDEIAVRWTCNAAVEYTISRDAQTYFPFGSAVTVPANEFQWSFSLQDSTLLDALPDPKVSREYRSVAEILSDLVPKKSGIICRLSHVAPSGNQDPTKLVLNLHFMSSAASGFTFGSYTFPASNEKITIDLRTSTLVDQFDISESAYDSWDQVKVESAFITTTATVPLYNDAFAPAWSADQLTDYLNPDVTAATSDEEKNRLADRIRNSQEYKEVFRTWVLKERTFNSPIDSNVNFYYWSPDPALIDTTSIPIAATTEIAAAFIAIGTPEDRIDLPRKEFLRELPRTKLELKGEFSKPEVFFPTERSPESGDIDHDASRWTAGSKLSVPGGWYEGRDWSTDMSVGRAESRRVGAFQGPSVSIDVHGGPNHFLAPDEMALADNLSPQNDPETDRVDGLNWKDAMVNVSIETDLRYSVSFPASPTPLTDSPMRVKVIRIEQARLDFALPGWCKKIDTDGHLVRSTDGSMIRDDRSLVEKAARVLWEMSSIARRPFNLSLKTISRQTWQVGTFVTSVQTAAGTDATNTFISQIEYDFKSMMISFTTQFEEADVIGMVIGASRETHSLGRMR